jgi:hypothetical protein
MDLSKSARYLFAFSVLLLFVAIILDFYISYDRPELKKKEITATEADSLFKQALKNFGITEKFISVRKNKKNFNDSVYSVKVFQDVPVSLILLEMENLFFPTTAEIKSIEEVPGGKVISGKKEKLVLLFITLIIQQTTAHYLTHLNKLFYY